MIKSVIVLVLLSLCDSFNADMNLNKEIIKSLSTLIPKVSFKSPETAQAPNTDNPKCVGFYSMELRKLLDNVTVTDDTVSLQPLKDNLEKLGKHQVRDQECTLIHKGFVKLNFNMYKKFFKKLNNHR